MKFTLQNGELVEAADNGGLMDKFNDFSDWVIGKEVELILAPIGAFLKGAAISFWHWFIVNLPDIMGYTTIGAGVFIILAAMFGRGGLMKPMAVWAGLMILAICILGGV